MPPPETERFCLGCRKKTKWQYNRFVGHSRCTECGGSFSSKEEIPEEDIEKAAENLMPWIKNNNNNK